MNATFWLFNKKENSTKTPTSTGTVLTIRLKDDCDVDNPVILCQTNVMSFNYMQFDGNYYFIVTKRYIANSLFEITATRDALASYKSEIKTSTQFVTRSSANYDYTLFDTMYPLKSEPLRTISAYTPTPFSWQDPTILITVKGASGSVIYATDIGSFKYLAAHFYAMSQEDIWQVIGNLPSGLTEPFTMTYFDPFSYIVDCRMVPITYGTPQGAQTWLDLGVFHFDDNACSFLNVTGSNIYTSSDSIQLSLQHVPTGSKEYLRSNKSRAVSLYCPGVGDLSFDCERGWDATYVAVDIIVDNKGHVSYRAQMGDDLQAGSGDISIPVAMYSNIMNVGGAVSGLTRVAGATVAGFVAGGVIGGVGGLVTGSLSAIASGSPLFRSASVGSDGSKASTGSMPNLILMETQYDIPTQSPNVFGYPCMKSITLGTDGYYQIDKPVVDFGDDLEVKNKIIEFMRSGFYVE